MKQQISQYPNAQHSIQYHNMEQYYPQKRHQHPTQLYSFHQIYSIRKQSTNYSNQLLYKKLSKSFNRIKKIRLQSNGILPKQFDYQNDQLKQTYKKIRDIYNLNTKTNQIVKKKIDKMRNKVDKVKLEVENSELFMIMQVDLSKIYTTRNTNLQLNNQPSQNFNQNNVNSQQKEKLNK